MHEDIGCLFLRRLGKQPFWLYRGNAQSACRSCRADCSDPRIGVWGGQVCAGSNVAILARVKNGLYHREIAVLKCACDVDGSLRGRPKSPLTQDSESSASRSRHQACHTSGRGALRIFNYQACSQKPRLWPSVPRTFLAPRHVFSHSHAGRFRLIELARVAINTFFTIRLYQESS